MQSKKDQEASSKDLADYFAAIQKRNTEAHQEAMARQQADAEALARLSKQQEEESAKLHGGSKKQVMEKAGKTQVLSWVSGIFDKHAANKHGFHPELIMKSARGQLTRKELKQADAIAKNDLDDCAFTFC